MKRFAAFVGVIGSCLALSSPADNVTPSQINPIVTYLCSNTTYAPKTASNYIIAPYIPANGPAHPITLVVQTVTTIASVETGSNWTANLYGAYDVTNAANAGSMGTNYCTNTMASVSNTFVGTNCTIYTNLPTSTWENATAALLQFSNSLSTNAIFTIFYTVTP